MRKILLLFTIFFILNPVVYAQNVDPHYQEKANFICTQIKESPSFNYEDYFSSEFIQQIPYEMMIDILQDLYLNFGSCAKAHFTDTSNKLKRFHLELTNQIFAKASIALEENEPYKISGFLFNGVSDRKIQIKSWKDLIEVGEQAGGLFSATLKNYSSQENSYEIQGSQFQALASGFKLYILGSLLNKIETKNLSWQQEFPIQPKWKSLPSGIMHTWPDGQRISIKDYAKFMISISDNTATDHLLHIIGRTYIESQLAHMRNSFFSMNTPFLSTMEMFKIKWALPLEKIHAFIAAEVKEKRSTLQELSSIPNEMIGKNGVPMDKPAFIRQIEWFASTNDMCEVMKWIKNKTEKLNDPTALDILAVNTPFAHVGADSHWSYAGYKGGSEPGVLTMTYLLKSKENTWGCLSMALNDEANGISQYLFFDIVEKTLRFSESQI